MACAVVIAAVFLQAEDRVDELTEDLLHTRHRLLATEEEKRVKEEEAAMVTIKMLLLAPYSKSSC